MKNIMTFNLKTIFFFDNDIKIICNNYCWKFSFLNEKRKEKTMTKFDKQSVTQQDLKMEHV